MKKYYSEKLDVWQNSRLFIKEIYQETLSFPTTEQYGLISQLRRASLSISANIAEGLARSTQKDRARFINLSFSSAIEVLNFLILSTDLGCLKKDTYLKLREMIEKITNQLNSFYNALKKSIYTNR